MDGEAVMQWFFLFVAIIAVTAFIVGQIRRRKELKELDRLLDIAIADDFQNNIFDETQISKISAKMYRYLNSARLKRSHLKEEQEQIRSLISDISHQTKTPLANILLYTQLLNEQSELSVQSREIVGQIGKSSDKLAFLIDALVKSSRLESGIIQINPKRYNVYLLVMDIVAECLPMAQAKNITIALPDEDKGVFASLDPKWCGEAVYNILDNAIKYTACGGMITITIHEYEMFACIRIKDTGKGISETDLPKIFSRFYRSADSADAEGVGVGLYLSDEIIQKCGGYIHAISELGKGSEFSVYLSKM